MTELVTWIDDDSDGPDHDVCFQGAFGAAVEDGEATDVHGRRCTTYTFLGAGCEGLDIFNLFEVERDQVSGLDEVEAVLMCVGLR